MNSIIYLGIDVHTTNFTFCALSVTLGEAPKVIAENQTEADGICVLEMVEYLKKQYGEDTNVICGYEAGCIGYTLFHTLDSHGIECKIIAPTTMPSARGKKRIKTDKRDAKVIAENLAYNTCSFVTVPEDGDMEIRDYIRMRDDHKLALKKIKQQILAFCTSHGYRCDSKNWTIAHIKWLRSFECTKMHREIIDEYLITFDNLTEKLERFETRIAELASGEKYQQDVKNLSCLLGIKTIGALSVLVETGDFTRFPTAQKYASFLGLVPGEHSSAEDVNRLGITKAGNTHLRKILIEASQGICKGAPGYKSKDLKARQQGCGADIIAYADKANERMRRRYYKLISKGKKRNVAVTAIARELACFIWGIKTGNIEIAS